MELLGLSIGVIIGCVFAPCFTMSLVMFHYDHPVIGFILMVISAIRFIVGLLDS